MLLHHPMLWEHLRELIPPQAQACNNLNPSLSLEIRLLNLVLDREEAKFPIEAAEMMKDITHLVQLKAVDPDLEILILLVAAEEINMEGQEILVQPEHKALLVVIQ